LSSPKISALGDQLRVLVVPALLFVILMAMTLGLRQISFDKFDYVLKQAAEDTSRKVVNVLQANLQERMMSMRQLANSFSVSDNEVSEAEFRGQCQFVMSQAPEVLALVRTDADRHPIWIEAERPMSAEDVESLTNDARMDKAIGHARLTNEYAISEKLTIPREGDGFVVLIPYSKAGTFSGFVLGVIGYSKLLNALLPLPELRAGFNIELRQANQKIFDSYVFSAERRTAQHDEEGPGIRRYEEFFFVGPQMWAVKVETSGSTRSASASFPSNMILILGALLSVIVSLYSYHQQSSLMRFQKEAYVSRNRLASTGLSLVQIQENFDLILNNVNEAIILYDENFAPLQANVAFKRSFENASTLQVFNDQELHHRAMTRMFQNESQYWSLLNSLKENPERPLEDEIETRHGSDESEIRYYQRRTASVCRPDGSRRGYLVLYQEVTAARSVERLKEDFISSVTHDLRSPLSSIKGFAETFLRNPDMDKPTRDEFATIIREEASRLEEMIEDLLDLRRMEDGRFDLAPSSYSLRNVIEESIRSMRPVLDMNDLKVEINWEGDGSGVLFGDIAKIGRAIRNVLSNSVKYSPPSSTIHVHGMEREDRTELEVTDEGPGIPPSELAHVFEKFFRGSKHVRRTKGTGLGLAIVKHIVESHGGTVSAANAPKKGTMIRIVLPREMPLSQTPVFNDMGSGEFEPVDLAREGAAVKTV